MHVRFAHFALIATIVATCSHASQAQAAPDVTAILKGLMSPFPDLPGPILSVHGTTEQAIYNVPYDLKATVHPIAPLEIQITSCVSSQSANTEVLKSLHLTQLAPTQQRIAGDATVYEWNTVSTDPRRKGLEFHRITTRIGSFAVNITSDSKPMVDAAYNLLRHQLTPG